MAFKHFDNLKAKKQKKKRKLLKKLQLFQSSKRQFQEKRDSNAQPQEIIITLPSYSGTVYRVPENRSVDNGGSEVGHVEAIFDGMCVYLGAMSSASFVYLLATSENARAFTEDLLVSAFHVM
ncbi:hypothetical protein ElyMa_006080700 [Elysia marginata]|uniref:Uncharacterized protein n=1 Tax=Elysia marginata TaxID=1093978 RepID=A0AAV4GRN3_9GAST|nr:hypothetical protein ElyMa_006080700 [Elysia marginata]